MNCLHQMKLPGGWLALSFAALLAAGCATPGTVSNPARPGDGLRAYQRLVLDLRKDATLTRKAVEALGAATQQNSGTTYARFAVSLQRLEVISIKARARVEAMEKRGEAYFEEWTEEISGTAGEEARRAAKERFAELHRHFEAILNDTAQVRQKFRPYLERLRELRTKLGPKPMFAAIESGKPDYAQFASAGRQAEESMSQLLKTLKAAEAAVMAGPTPLPKPGGKL